MKVGEGEIMFSNEKGLFVMAKKSRYLPNIVLAIILTLVFMIVGQTLGTILSVLFGAFINYLPVKVLLNLIFSFIFIMIFVFVWIKLVENRSVSSIGLERKGLVKKYFFGFGIGFLMFSLVILLLFINGNITLVNNSPYVVGISALGSILIILPGWAVQSATEEILSRGWLMNVVGARYNGLLGLIISSALFSSLHLLNNNVSILAIINIFLVGIFFGLYVIKTKDLWGACGIHCAWNWAQGNIFGLEVSGNTVNVGSLMNLNLKGNELITGGSFGPEAGLAAAIVLLIGVIIVFIGLKKEG